MYKSLASVKGNLVKKIKKCTKEIGSDSSDEEKLRAFFDRSIAYTHLCDFANAQEDAVKALEICKTRGRLEGEFLMHLIPYYRLNMSRTAHDQAIESLRTMNTHHTAILAVKKHIEFDKARVIEFDAEKLKEKKRTPLEELVLGQLSEPAEALEHFDNVLWLDCGCPELHLSLVQLAEKEEEEAKKLMQEYGLQDFSKSVLQVETCGIPLLKNIFYSELAHYYPKIAKAFFSNGLHDNSDNKDYRYYLGKAEKKLAPKPAVSSGGPVLPKSPKVYSPASAYSRRDDGSLTSTSINVEALRKELGIEISPNTGSGERPIPPPQRPMTKSAPMKATTVEIDGKKQAAFAKSPPAEDSASAWEKILGADRSAPSPATGSKRTVPRPVAPPPPRPLPKPVPPKPRELTLDDFFGEPEKTKDSGVLIDDNGNELVIHKGTRICKREYQALERIAKQAGFAPDEYQVTKRIDLNMRDKKVAYIDVEDGHVCAIQVQGYQLDNLEAFGDLCYLQSLHAAENQITKVSGIDKLQRLAILNLRQNQIQTTEGMDRLTNLRTLSLSFNNISRVVDINHLNKITTLSLRHNKLTSIGGVFNLPLQQLLIMGNEIPEDDLVLINLKERADLDLSCDEPLERPVVPTAGKRDPDGLLKINNTQVCRRDYHALRFIARRFKKPVKDFEAVDSVRMNDFCSLLYKSQRGSQVAVDSVMNRRYAKNGLRYTVKDGRVTGIEISRISEPISDLRLFEFFPDLETISLYDTGTKSLAGAENLKLKYLSVVSNGLSDTVSFSGLGNVEEIIVAHNNISRITGVEECKSLKNLVVIGNPLQYIPELAESSGNYALCFDWKQFDAVKGNRRLDDLLRARGIEVKAGRDTTIFGTVDYHEPRPEFRSPNLRDRYEDRLLLQKEKQRLDFEAARRKFLEKEYVEEIALTKKKAEQGDIDYTTKLHLMEGKLNPEDVDRLLIAYDADEFVAAFNNREWLENFGHVVRGVAEENMTANTPRSLLALGYLAECRGELEEAVRYYEFLDQISPNYRNCGIKLASIYETIGDYDKAVMHYGRNQIFQSICWLSEQAVASHGIVQTAKRSTMYDAKGMGASIAPENLSESFKRENINPLLINRILLSFSSITRGRSIGRRKTKLDLEETKRHIAYLEESCRLGDFQAIINSEIPNYRLYSDPAKQYLILGQAYEGIWRNKNDPNTLQVALLTYRGTVDKYYEKMEDKMTPFTEYIEALSGLARVARHLGNDDEAFEAFRKIKEMGDIEQYYSGYVKEVEDMCGEFEEIRAKLLAGAGD
jgi:Leucine-rich repeat (LRR) protein